MKNLAPSFLLALLALTGCGAAAEGFDASEEGSWEEPAAESADSAGDTGADVEIGSTQQGLISGGVAGGLGAKPWCAARKTCYDQCDRDYPSGGGPLSTCKQLCDQTTASKCRPGAVGGAVLF